MRNSFSTNIPPIAILVYTIAVIVVAYIISWQGREYMLPVDKLCGRKEAFSKNYMTYIYSADALGFIISLVFSAYYITTF